MSRRTAAAVAVVTALLISAPAAPASYDPVGSGSTKIVLDKGLLRELREQGVKLRAQAPVRYVNGSAVFPVVGGKIDPTAESGTVEHDGALLLSAGGRSIRLKGLQLKTTRRRSPFAVKAGGSQLKLSDSGRIAVARSGFGERISVGGLTFSKTLATRLAKKLRLRGILQQGDPLGRAVTVVQPLTAGLRGEGEVAWALAPGFAAKLDSLFVAVNPVFPAEHPGDFTFPIFGGGISPDVSVGRVETRGALELLQLGGGQVFWTEPELDFSENLASAEADVEPSPPFGGKIGRVPIAVLDPAGAAFTSKPGPRTISASGLTAKLDAAMAAALNQAFAQGEPKFEAGETIASASFSAYAQ